MSAGDLKTLIEPGTVFEVRLLDVKTNYAPYTASGYFDDTTKAWDAIQKQPECKGAYITMNPVEPALLSRRANRIARCGKGDATTGNHEILKRARMLLDVDPDRPAGICATDAEKKKAAAVATAIREGLRAEGWPEPLVCDSGNGIQLFYRVDLPADDGGLIERTTKTIAARYDAPGAHVDLSVHNAARISRIPGTMNRKGDDTTDRPHRMACILEAPEPFEVVSRELLEAMAPTLAPVRPAAAVANTTKPHPGKGWTAESWRAFIHSNFAACEPGEPEPYKGAYKIKMDVCPFNSTHTESAVSTFNEVTGAGFVCLHNSCAAHGWQDLRALVEPGRKQGAEPQAAQTDCTSTRKAPAGTDFDSVRGALWEIKGKNLPANEFNREAAGAVVAWLCVRGRFYHHAERRDFASVMYFDATRKLLLPVQSDGFLAWLADALAVNRSERIFAFISAAIENEGLSERATPTIPATYWARGENAFYISNGPGRLVRITAGSVQELDNGTDGILFPYGGTLAPWNLTEGRDPFEACRIFRDMACTAAHGFDLFRLWSVSIPTNPVCKPPLCPTGPAGSGKTAGVRGLYRLFGIPEQIAAVNKNGESDFWTGMDGGGIYCLDNADVKIDWLPDAAAAAATGAANLKRQLYTDNGRVTQRPNAWLAITSLNPTFASDCGLADRTLPLRMKRREGETAESALFNEVDAARDAGLSWIADTLAKALADRAPVPSGLNQRHPDFAALAVRIGRAMGKEAEAINALRAAEADKGLFNLENDSIGAALLELVADAPFEGSAAELLEALSEIDSGFSGRMTVKGLGKRISKLWPHLESTLQAVKFRDPHAKNWRYGFKPAVFAVFQEPIQQKSYARENNRTLPETPLPNTANTANQDLFTFADVPEQPAENWEVEL